jgi:hypothetical protein
MEKLHNQKLHNLNSSPHVTRKIKSRRMKYAGKGACMEEIQNTCGDF